MELGIPKEVRQLESRVGLTPAGVDALTKNGHTVWVEGTAGTAAGFKDETYETVGARIAYSPEELYGRSEVVIKVARPTAGEHKHFRPDQVLLSFLNLAVASPDLLEALRHKRITAIGYETIRTGAGILPVLTSSSEVAGRMAAVIAGQMLTSPAGGRGMLLSGVPGVPPAAVVIIGAGVVGTNAVRGFLGLGAQVTILDSNPERLRRLDEICGSRVATMMASPYNIEKVVSFADVLILSVLIPGGRAPILLTRAMVQRMKPGSVIIDYAIDQGGASETSRPTTLHDPIYEEEGVLHYCVPNMPALVARTASHALTNAALPYILILANQGAEKAIRTQPDLARGVNTYQGRLAHPDVAAALGLTPEVNISGPSDTIGINRE
ncbi:MAG: alanine dehydrogenase [Chloroflexi bacterium]|nr:alanine dehydrogenase [Chloroflexota bacterium]